VNPRVLFALAALVPAALNTSPAAGRSLIVPLCTGDGVLRSISLPPGGEGPPGKEAPGCCAKACHTGSRKRTAARQFDPGQ